MILKYKEAKRVGIIDHAGCFASETINRLKSMGLEASQMVVFFDRPEEFAPLRETDTLARQLKPDASSTMVGGFSDIDKLIITLPLIEKTDYRKRMFEIMSAARLAAIGHVVILAPSPGFGNFTHPFCNISDHVEDVDFGLPYTLLLNGIDRESIFNLAFLRTLSIGGISSATLGRKFNFASRSDIALAIAKVVMGKHHKNKIYHLTCSYLHSFEDMAQIASRLTHMKVRNFNVDGNTLKKIMVESGTPLQQADIMVEVLHRKIAEGLFEYTTENLDNILSAREENFESFAKKFLVLG